MALDYSINDSLGNYFEFRIPIANYYKDEGVFFNETSMNNWKGFNDEQYSYRRENKQVYLYDDTNDILIQKITIEEYSIWLKGLLDNYQSLDIAKPIIDILKNIESNDLEVVAIGFS